MVIQASFNATQAFSEAHGVASCRAPDVGALLGGGGQGLATPAVQANSVRRSENARHDRRLTALRGSLRESSPQVKTAAPCALLRAAPSPSARAASLWHAGEGD